jgi:hypothetical protein
MDLFTTLSINDIQHDGIESHYRAECRVFDCYADCLMQSVIMQNVMAPVFNENLIIFGSIVHECQKSFSKAGNHKCLSLFDTQHKFVIYDNVWSSS